MPQVYGKAGRAKPTAVADAAQGQVRVSRFTDQMMQPVGGARHSLCEEGSYFSAVNPTPGTGIAHTIRATFSATDGIFLIRNAGSGGEYLFMDYLRLIPTVAPVSATRSELLLTMDSASRYSSGGSALTPINRNMAGGGVSIATVRFGALALAAEGGGTRRISRAQVGTTIPVAFEEVFIQFGSESAAPGTLGATVGMRKYVPVAACALGNTHDLIVHLWHAGNITTAGSWEVEAGWWER